MADIPPTPPQTDQQKIDALLLSIERLKVLIAAGGNQELADALLAHVLALQVLGFPVTLP